MEQIVQTPKQIGDVLRCQRRASCLNQTDLAGAASLRQEMVSKIETGSPGTRLASICALLTALDLELVVRKRTIVCTKNTEKIL